MTPAIGLTIALCASGGIALGLTISAFRRRAAYGRLEAETASLHRRFQATNDELLRLREQVEELGPVLIDGQRRWGFDPGRWPDAWELVGQPSSAAVSWWLLQHAPGIGLLRDGGQATDRFYPVFNGWRPPQLPEGR